MQLQPHIGQIEQYFINSEPKGEVISSKIDHWPFILQNLNFELDPSSFGNQPKNDSNIPNQNLL